MADTKQSVLTRALKVVKNYLSNSEAKVAEIAESYTPAEETDWDVAPTTQDAALDELAARVKALEDA